VWRDQFQHTRYGPMQIRGVWRARRLPGERIVGWGVVWPPPSASQAALQVALAMIPALGQLAAMAIAGPGAGERWFMILSDRRVMLLHPGAPGPERDGRGVYLDEPLELIEVTCDPPPRPRKRASATPPAARAEIPAYPLTFELHLVAAPPLRLELKPASPAGVRLRQGLLLLAGYGEGESS
jgi:hypothetical protein